MYSDAQQGFQQLAMQAMAASSAIAAQHRDSEVSECPSTLSRMGEDHSPGAGMASSPRRRRDDTFKPQRTGRPPISPSHVAGSAPAPSPAPAPPPPKAPIYPSHEHHQENRNSVPLQPPFPIPPAEPRRSRRTDQTRRSERAYAPRRSVVPGTRRSFGATPRGSVASVLSTPWTLGDDDEDYHEDVDALDWEVPGDGGDGTGGAARHRRWIWTILVPFMFSLIFILGGVLYLVYGSDKMIKNLQIWRLSFFLAGLPIIWWAGEGVTLAAVWFVERSMFKVQNALYYAYSVRRPLANVVRAALSLGWWALSMTAWSTQQDGHVKDAIQVILKVWACVTLFMTANLLKTLIAKLLSSKFNKESHARKIQESLVKEYYLHMLLEPREREGYTDGLGGDGGNDGSDGVPGSPKTGTTVQSATQMAGAFGNAIASSMRGVTSTVFGSKLPPREQLATSCEELLEHNGDNQALSPRGAVTVDIQVLQRQHQSQQHQTQSNLRSCRTSTDAPQNINRQASVTSSRERVSWAHSLGDARSHCPVSQGPRPSSTRRASKLAPVMEEMVEKNGTRRGLSANQLAKMELYIRRQALQVTFRDELSATERQEEVTSAAEAKKMAFYLFWNAKADLERPYLTVDDVADFLPPDEAEEAFAMLDQNGNGRVSLQECIAVVLSIYEARCDLALSLKDTRSVVNKLENVIGVVVHVIFVFLYMVVFQVDVVKTYLALSSLVLAFSFVFQNSIRTMYENVVFLFVVHPFDVGDVLQMGETDAAPTYRVDQIDLHYTIFVSGSGMRTWYPNQKIMATPFSNVSASGERGDSVKVLIDMETPAGALDDVRAACEAAAAAQPTEFCEDISLHLRDCTSPMKVALVIGFKYTHNGADGARTSRARTAIHAAFADALNNAGVRYTSAPSKDDGGYGACYDNIETIHVEASAGAQPVAAGKEEKKAV